MTTEPNPAPAEWIDGHPQLEAIAAAVWERCRTEGTSLIVDDPRNIAVAALAALPEPSAPTGDQNPLRDRIAEALADIDGWGWMPGFDKNQSPAYQQYLVRADKVLAVLPEAPGDLATARTAALREAADIADETVPPDLPRADRDQGRADAAHDIRVWAADIEWMVKNGQTPPEDRNAAVLRRLAAGAQQPMRVKHSGPNTKFCVLCLSGEHERVDEAQQPVPPPVSPAEAAEQLAARHHRDGWHDRAQGAQDVADLLRAAHREEQHDAEATPRLARYQTCDVCGAGYETGSTCTTCAFNARMAGGWGR